MKTKQIIILVLALVLIGVGIFLVIQALTKPTNNQENQSPETTPPAITPFVSTPQTYDVEISGFAFSPATLTIKVGDIVKWTNADSAPHTIVSDTGTELSSLTLSAENTGSYYSSGSLGGIYSHTFSTAGTYAYHCSIHQTMKGTIVVEA